MDDDVDNLFFLHLIDDDVFFFHLIDDVDIFLSIWSMMMMMLTTFFIFMWSMMILTTLFFPFLFYRIFRDWKPGEFVQDQVYTAVSQSRRTLVILSENYVNSIWGRAEFRVAHTRALQERVDRVVVVLYGDMPPKQTMDDNLRTYVNLKTYLKWGDSLFWERLR